MLCKREQRYIGQQLSFSYERKQIILEKNGISCGLVGKEQRVTHTAITGNKRLGEVRLPHRPDFEPETLAQRFVK
ncbi:transposase (plasmid) [Mesorhizobium japonicum MAFF 303099]|uniref:Transposase n=1 Tax=Mesorhizobium japonicum (strain LMG 29417 / CECT 9101 / MAFF 303099) TaxID=266835 RepID=Q981U1_RHILO|nr:transposase [Mesorhizobium japonicum MAFF 303099]